MALSAARYYRAFSALQDGRNEVETARSLFSGDLSHLDASRVARAQAHLRRAADDFGPESQLSQDGWLARAGSHLPWLSTQLGAATDLRRAGAAGTQVGLDVLQVLQDVVPGPNPDPSSSPLQRLVQLASRHPGELALAAQHVATFQQTLAVLAAQPRPGPLEGARRTVLAQGTTLTSTAAPALQLLNAIPAAIGSGTHSYLLLLGNPGEERPSGGYIGAVGELSFTDGAISRLMFRGSEYYTPLVRNIAPPAPLAAHLFTNHPWELDDANWSADFPTAMADVERFYSAATHERVDGEISVDPVALSYLLRVIGPAQVPGYPQVLTSANVLRELNYITNKARPQDPGKVFLPPFGKLVTDLLLKAPVRLMPRLAEALHHGAREKHIALFFHDQRLQALVDGAGFSGRLTTPTSDSVFVNDANLSGTKGDLFVTRRMHLDVSVHSNGNADDQLTLTYTNPVVTNPADLALLPHSGAQYRDYVRVYLPETARLKALTVSHNGAKPVDSAPETVTYEFGQQAIAYWFVVPVGGTEEIRLSYSGPFADISASPERYQLSWLKQVNALPWPITVNLTRSDGSKIQWAAQLTGDRRWSTTG